MRFTAGRKGKMKRERETFDDLDEMREDLEGLRAAFGASAGEATRSRRDAGPAASPERKPAGAPKSGRSRKGRRRGAGRALGLIALGLALSVHAAATAGAPSPRAAGHKDTAPGPAASASAAPASASPASEAPAPSAPAPATAPGEAKADSLHALRFLLSKEVKPGNEVLILKNPRLSDSLLRHPQESFVAGLRGSGLARPIRSPEEFRAYWDRIEKENGIPALQSQMAAHDIDKGRIPKAYLFDSSVVVYPGWIIVRHKLHR
jgi:hypothetical protein